MTSWLMTVCVCVCVCACLLATITQKNMKPTEEKKTLPYNQNSIFCFVFIIFVVKRRACHIPTSITAASTTRPGFGMLRIYLFAVHGLSERTTVQTSSIIVLVKRRNQPTAMDLYFLDWVRTRYKTESETHTKSAHTVL